MSDIPKVRSVDMLKEERCKTCPDLKDCLAGEIICCGELIIEEEGNGNES